MRIPVGAEPVAKAEPSVPEHLDPKVQCDKSRQEAERKFEEKRAATLAEEGPTPAEAVAARKAGAATVGSAAAAGAGRSAGKAGRI